MDIDAERARLLERAEECDRLVARLAEQIGQLREQARVFREAADRLRLSTVPGSGTLDPGMHVQHRIARSAANAAPDDEFITTINSAGFTLRSLAEALKVSPSLISHWRSGLKAIRGRHAAHVEMLTGWPASRWPRRALE